MSPILLTGAGWLLSALGLGFLGGFGGLAAILGFAVMAYGLQQIRWRDDWFDRAFWLTVVALALWVVTFVGLIFDRSQFYTLSLTQAAIAFATARGIGGCLVPAGGQSRRLLTLSVTSIVIAVSTTVIVLLDVLAVAGTDLPATPVSALLFVSALAGIAFGVLLLTLNREPALQAHSRPA